jgi:hypothetical protein
MGLYVDLLAGVAEARLSFGIGEESGLTSDVAMVPRPGSELAKLAATRHPYDLAPALTTGAAPAMLWALGDGGVMRLVFARVRDALMSLVPAGERARTAEAADAMVAALAGASSGRFDLAGTGKLGFNVDAVYGLGEGTDPRALLGSMETLLRSTWMTKLFEGTSGGLLKAKLTTKREGEALVTRMAFDTKAMPAEARKELAGLPLFDGKPLETRTAVNGGKLFMTMGEGTKDRLAALTRAAGAPTPSEDVAAALAETAGADGFYFMDFGAFVRAGIAAQAAQQGQQGMGPAMMMTLLGPMLAQARLSLWGSWRGGDAMTITGRVPMSTFESAAQLARLFMGGLGGGMGAPGGGFGGGAP